MKKIIISFLLILMIAVIGMIVLFIKSINYVNYENDLVFEETTKEMKSIGYSEDEIVEKYVDEYGMEITNFSDGTGIATYPEDVRTWSMQSKDMREAVIHDAMQGRPWDQWALRNEYPITDNFFKEWDENGWSSLEVLFPGYKYAFEYNLTGGFGLYVDDFEKTDKEGIAHAVIRSKYYDTRYDFKYYLDNEYNLDKIEYLSQEIVKDYTKEVERDERIYLMVKDGDEIHNDNEYLTVLWEYSDNINVTDFDSSLESDGIIEELKEKKYIENVLPIPYDIDYEVWLNINYANYEKKEAEVFIRYRESNRCEKYLISFDYNDEYYLTKYEVIGREDITLEDYERIAIPLLDQKQILQN